MNRPRAAVIVAGCAAGVAAVSMFLRSTPDAFPFGDAAVIQIYTLQALRTGLALGPYSQFGWHHPGPLYFYLLTPFYDVARRRAIGLVAGAIAINGSAALAAGSVVRRNAGSGAAAIIVASIATFLWRADGVLGSVWNPHVVVVPLGALLVCCAAVAAGDVAALPVAVAAASFVVQTDIAVLPCATVVVVLGLSGLAARRKYGAMNLPLIRLSIAIALVAWLPPLVEQITRTPGNLTRIWDFFVARAHGGQSVATAFAVWADATTAYIRPHITAAWGAAYHPYGSPAIGALAVLQAGLLAAAAVRAHRREQPFAVRLCGLVLVASVVAGCSVTRIDDEIGDYQIFWMSILGVASGAAVLVSCLPWRPDRRVEGRVMTVSTAAAIVVLSVQALLSARAYAVEQRDDPGLSRKVATLDLLSFMAREHIRRPLFHIARDRWLDAACLVLHAYKDLPEAAVEQEWVGVFGPDLSPTGREDADVYVVGGAQHEWLSSRPGGRLIADRDGLFVHVFRR